MGISICSLSMDVLHTNQHSRAKAADSILNFRDKTIKSRAKTFPGTGLCHYSHLSPAPSLVQYPEYWCRGTQRDTQSASTWASHQSVVREAQPESGSSCHVYLCATYNEIPLPLWQSFFVKRAPSKKTWSHAEAAMITCYRGGNLVASAQFCCSASTGHIKHNTVPI